MHAKLTMPALLAALLLFAGCAGRDDFAGLSDQEAKQFANSAMGDIADDFSARMGLDLPPSIGHPVDDSDSDSWIWKDRRKEVWVAQFQMDRPSDLEGRLVEINPVLWESLKRVCMEFYEEDGTIRNSWAPC